MGRIKTDAVKRTTFEMIESHPEKFAKTFDKNKEALKGLAEIRSKKLRNVIAGYAVRLKKRGDDLTPRPRRRMEEEPMEGMRGRRRPQGNFRQ